MLLQKSPLLCTMSFHAITKPWLGARETTKSPYHTYTLCISMPFPIRYIHVYNCGRMLLLELVVSTNIIIALAHKYYCVVVSPI